MARKYLLVNRNNKIIYFDSYAIAIVSSLLMWYHYKYNWAFILLTSILIFIGFLYAFLSYKIFRSIATVFISMVYGFVAFIIGLLIDQSTVIPAVIFAYLAYFFSLFLHKDHFDFLSNAKVIEYERH